MAQSDYNPYQAADSEESGGKSSGGFLSKLKDKTKEHGRKIKGLIHSDKGDDGTDVGGTDESGYDENESETVNDTTGAGATEQPGGVDQQSPAGDDGDASDLSKNFQGLSTNENPSDSTGADDKPVTQSVQDNVSSATDQTKESLLGGGVGGEDNVSSATDQTKESLLGGGVGGDDAAAQESPSPDAPAQLTDEEPQQQASDSAAPGESPQEAPAPGESLQQTADGGKTWSQWASEKVPTTADGTPIHQHAYNTIVGAKNSAASQIPDQSAIPSDPAQQTYFQKAAGGIYGAKDKVFTATQPADHHKALSQQVTESVGNLPSTLKSSLGFGKGASPPTTPGGVAGDVPQEAAGAPPQSPGLVSRITGLFGAKKPATEESTPSTEPPTSEAGQNLAEATPTSDVSQDI